jgi:hypothetical protein
MRWCPRRHWSDCQCDQIPHRSSDQLARWTCGGWPCRRRAPPTLSLGSSPSGTIRTPVSAGMDHSRAGNVRILLPAGGIAGVHSSFGRIRLAPTLRARCRKLSDLYRSRGFDVADVRKTGGCRAGIRIAMVGAHGLFQPFCHRCSGAAPDDDECVRAAQPPRHQAAAPWCPPNHLWRSCGLTMTEVQPAAEPRPAAIWTGASKSSGRILDRVAHAHGRSSATESDR